LEFGAGGAGFGRSGLAGAILGPFRILCRRDGGFAAQLYACMTAGVLTLLPILLFVHRYIDDVGRSMEGYTGWLGAARPLAEGLFVLVNLGTPAVAVAPLYQLLSIALLSIVCVITARVYGIRAPFWTAVGTLPLLAQPYLLENLSYGFDCLGMAMSMSLAVLAAVVLAIVPGRSGLIGTSILLTASLCLYQPGSSAFLPFALMLLIGRKLGQVNGAMSERPIVGTFLRILTSYVVALGLYRLILLVMFRSPVGYAANQGQLLAFDVHLPAALLQNAGSFWRAIYDDWNGWPLAGLVLALGLAYALMVWQSLPTTSGSGSRPWLRLRRLLAVLAAVVVISLVSPGALLAMKDPLVRLPRMLLFVGPFLAALNLQILAGVGRLPQCHGGFSSLIRSAQLAAVIAFAWLLVVFAYAYGHAFAAQAEFEAGRISRLVEGVDRLQQRQGGAGANEMSFVGVMPQSPVLRNTQKKFPLVNRLVPRLIADDWWWGWKQLQLHGVNLGQSRQQQGDLTDAYCRDPATAECTAEFSLQVQGKALLVRIK
jgi:hypothetical protein